MQNWDMNKWTKPQTPAVKNGNAPQNSAPQTVQTPPTAANMPAAAGTTSGTNSPNVRNAFNGQNGPQTSFANAPGTVGGTAAAASQFAGNMDSKILEEARRMKQEALDNYEKAKEEATKAFATYSDIVDKTIQAQQEVNMARTALEQAKGTPQESAAQAAFNQAQSKFEALRAQRASAESVATTLRQNMNAQAVSYHVNSQKAAAYAAGNGNSFNEAKAAAEASANNLGRITAEMERVLNARPRPENSAAASNTSEQNPAQPAKKG